MQAAALASAPAILSSPSGPPRRSAAPVIIFSASARPRRGPRSAVRCEVASSSAPSAAGPLPGRWAQRTVVIPPQRRGCHLITSKIVNDIRNDLAEFKCGMAHLFLQHTSASLTINENYDSDVQDDTETFLNRIVPEGPFAPWRHTIEDYYDLPFSDVLDWRKFAVVLKESDIYQLKSILKSISQEEFVALHKSLVKVQKHFEWHSPPIPYDAFHMVMYELWLRHHVIKY